LPFFLGLLDFLLGLFFLGIFVDIAFIMSGRLIIFAIFSAIGLGNFDIGFINGAIIGVIGDAQIDRSLQLNVITPVRVDVLRPRGAVDMLPASEGGTNSAAPANITPPPVVAQPAPADPAPIELPDGGEVK
jgi:hypothetical protein